MALVVTLTALPAPAWAQSSVTYSLAGVETAATSTQGTFVGVAQSADDFATWAAMIAHDSLDPSVDSVAITGGTFALDGQARLRGCYLRRRGRTTHQRPLLPQREVPM